jgi:GR25 family glycosyltransferase involved in LPS biosynthesis
MIPCYVITLKDDFPNRRSLSRIGLNPVGFKGVNASKDEHLQHSDKIDEICRHTCPKSTIGCGLSHILLAEKLYDEQVPVALVLEDDTYPKNSEINFEQIISDVPDDWEIIKLHCFPYCADNSYTTNILDGSAAAYIINRKGMYKIKNLKVKFHVDIQYNIDDIRVYKSLYNIFSTDESSSEIRGQSIVHWSSYFLPNPTSGEHETKHLVNYKLFKLPGTNIELKVYQLVDIICLILIIYIVYNVVTTRR